MRQTTCFWGAHAHTHTRKGFFLPLPPLIIPSNKVKRKTGNTKPSPRAEAIPHSHIVGRLLSNTPTVSMRRRGGATGTEDDVKRLGTVSSQK